MPKRKSRDDLETFQNGHGSLDVLRRTFSKIYSLHDFLQQHVSDEVLLLPDDPEKYALVLKTSVVGIHGEAVIRAASRFRAGGVTITPSSRKIKEVLDMVVAELLSKSRRGMSQNIITLGFSKNNTEGTTALTSIVQEYASSHYMALCTAEWQLLLERIGDSAMIFLLTSTCVFLEFGNQSYYQAVGFPIYDIKGQKDRWQTKRRKVGGQTLNANGCKALEHEPSHLARINRIVIYRNQMLYTSPRLKSNGYVTFGLYPQNCLGRYCDHTNTAHTKSALKYVFRKQYGLKNVFDMAAYGQDLPMRGLLVPHVESDDLERKKPLPKTLKGRPFELFRQIQHRQEKCPYGILIQYYCPSKDSPLFPNEQSLTEISSNVAEEVSYGMQVSKNFLHNTTRHNQVAAFVKSVVKKLLPAKAFGSRTNWNIIMRHIDTYISLGRYEKMTMHGLIQGISVCDITWLGKLDCGKMPLGEYNKRSIILSEFVYWLFDSLIPSIIRGNFFVTDSAATRNRLVYFRHDVWHRLSQPALNQIISTMFDEIPMKLLKTIAEGKTRKLGFAGIRLLPKATGVRLIMRLNKAGLRKGVLGNIPIPKMSKSINQAMKPVLQVLQYEHSVNKEALGSAILGTADALPKLLAFQKSLKDQGLLGRNLYFVKVDIQSCFDSIPPVQAYRSAKKFFRLNEYRIRKFIMVSMKNNDVFKRFISAAYPGPLDDPSELEYDPMENSDFSLFVKRTAKNFENKIFIDGAKVTFYERQELLRLLVEHIAGHIVQIGRKFYKQKKGIPQGSVVSTFLCNLLYSQLELEKLAFTSDKKDSLLLRLTDDFLYITLDRDKAVTFFRHMLNGYPEYGATINPAKSLTNFDLKMPHLHVPVLTRTSEFPYCGLTIHTTTLNVKRDLFKNPDQDISGIQTIEYSYRPSESFTKRMLLHIPILFSRLYGDSVLNSRKTILINIHRTFIDVAMRYAYYVRQLSRLGPRLSWVCMKDTIADVIRCVLSNARRYGSNVSADEVHGLGYAAFIVVLRRKQSSFRDILQWLESIRQTQSNGICSIVAKVAMDDQSRRIISVKKY